MKIQVPRDILPISNLEKSVAEPAPEEIEGLKKEVTKKVNKRMLWVTGAWLGTIVAGTMAVVINTMLKDNELTIDTIDYFTKGAIGSTMTYIGILYSQNREMRLVYYPEADNFVVESCKWMWKNKVGYVPTKNWVINKVNKVYKRAA